MKKTLIAALALVTLFAGNAGAQERDLQTPTGWWWLRNAAPADVTNRINQGFRLTDIEVEGTAPYRFSANFVANQGSHASGFWWYYGLSAADVSARLSQHNARLIDLDPYFVGGALRFAAVMVPNTGAQAKAWWWYYGQSVAQVAQRASQNGARVVDVDSYVEGGVRKYSAVMIRNAGADQRAWWHYYDISSATLAQKLSQDAARIVDLERLGDDRFAVVLAPAAGYKWWYYFGRTEQQVNDLVGRNGARLIDVESRVVDGTRLFDVVMLNNSNALTTRVGDLLRARTNGHIGMYLKRVGGGVLGALQENRRFEPASTIKVLHLTAAMDRVGDGLLNLNQMVSVCMDNGANGCPNTLANCATTQQMPLSQVLSTMMQNSDNRSTQAIRELVGQNFINATATAMGLGDTATIHQIGCGADMIVNHNRTTLSDLGELYETVATGFILPGLLNTYYNLMSNGDAPITNIINAEGAALGKSAATMQAFRNNTRVTWKAGSYGWNGTSWRSDAGIARLPFRVNGVVQQRAYVFGVFIDSATTLNPDDIRTVGAETLREQIRAALQTW